MAIDKWVIKNQDNSLSLNAINKRPKNAVGLLPPGEDVAWLQLELIDDGTGNMVETITVDQITKDAVLQQRFDDESARQTAESAAQAVRTARHDKVKNINTNAILGLNDLKQAIADIQDWIANQE